jgi:hypothetical protein
MSGLNALAQRIYEGNVARGFHEEGDTIRRRGKQAQAFVAAYGPSDPRVRADGVEWSAIQRRDYANYATKRIALIVTEAAEAIEEIRSGHAVDETYYPTNPHGNGPWEQIDQGVVQHKPEGVPSELADILIRTLDVMVEFGIDVDEIVEEKLGYNATRGFRHGGKAF